MSETSTAAGTDISRRRAEDLVAEMMAIPGKSCQEARVADSIRAKLENAGVPRSAITHDAVHRRSPAGGETGNLIVKLRGTRRGPRRLLTGHIDTVPLCVGSRPVRRNGVYESRDPHTALGADNRAGASVVLNAVLEIQRRQLPHPPLTLFWPVQEEIGLYGARFGSLAKLGHPKLCFNWDGSLPHVATVGATGDVSIHIEVNGIASHAGVHPELGVSAIAIAGLAIADLVRDGWHGAIVKGQNTGTSNIGFVNAGEATNVVTPRLTLKAEARSHDPKFRKQIVAAFERAFTKAAKTVKNELGQAGSVLFRAEPKYESFRLTPNEPCVQSALAAIQAVGLEPETKVANGGLDANWLTARGLPTVTLGCGQLSPHTVDEQLHIDSYLQACRIGLLLATGAV